MHLSRYMFLLNENLNIMLGHEIWGTNTNSVEFCITHILCSTKWGGLLEDSVKDWATCAKSQQPTSAKKWLCSKKSVKSCKAVVVFNKRCNQAETLCPPRWRGERDCKGWSDISSPWSLQCWTLLCLWLCWQRYIFPLDSRTWTWTSDRGIVWAG